MTGALAGDGHLPFVARREGKDGSQPPSPVCKKPSAQSSGGTPAGWQLPSPRPRVPAGQPSS